MLNKSAYLRLMRCHSLSGFYLLLLPVLWALFIAADPTVPFTTLLVFILGAFLMRSAGCIINDLFDRDLDRRVTRTKHRPLAAGDITINQALILLLFILLLAAMLLFSLNRLTIFIGISAIIPIVIYPYMKRITYWPQAFLAFTFNLGVLMSFTALNDRLNFTALLLYTATIAWTLAYDTIYAHQDKADDLAHHMRSSALLLGNKTHFFLKVCYSIMAIILCLIGLINDLPLIYFLMLAISFIFLYIKILPVNIDNIQECGDKFHYNVYFGILILIAIVLGKLC